MTAAAPVYDASSTDPVRIAADVFPATIRMPGDEVYRRARVVLLSPTPRLADADHLDVYVFQDLAPHRCVATARVLPPDPPLPRSLRPNYRYPLLPLSAAPAPSTPYSSYATPRADEDSVVLLIPDGACGCGSRLKNVRLFRSQARVNMR